MEYIQITEDNLEQEHICCAISNNRDVQVSSKKAWLKDRLAEGLVFLKGAERGKCFIEYMPAESAWVPVQADNYMHINCLWVSGSFKGHGYSNDLLASCIADSQKKHKAGLCILSSAKKRGFLADPKYLSHKGFRAADEAPCGIQLWYLPFDTKSETPRFRTCAKQAGIDVPGTVIYYTHQCPFNAKYIPLLEAYAKDQNLPFQAIHIQTKEEAQNAPAPVTPCAVFYDGVYITNETLNEKKFQKLLGV